MIPVILPWRLSTLSIRHQLLRPSSLRVNKQMLYIAPHCCQQAASCESEYANYLYVNNHLKNLNNSMSQRERHSHSESVSGDSFYIKSSSAKSRRKHSIVNWPLRAMNGWIVWGGEGGSRSGLCLSFDCFAVYTQQFEPRITISFKWTWTWSFFSIVSQIF